MKVHFSLGGSCLATDCIEHIEEARDVHVLIFLIVFSGSLCMGQSRIGGYMWSSRAEEIFRVVYRESGGGL